MKTSFTIKNKLIIAGFIVSAIGVTGSALAKTKIMDHSTMSHNKMMHNTKTNNKKSSMPVLESGQSAFAAIAEIVAKLESNPDTNWNVVDIKGLREHL
jgi:lysine/ornithine N-monooxygenase